MNRALSSVSLAAVLLAATSGCSTTSKTAECCGACTVAPAGASTAVNSATADALRAALDDERRTQAFYDSVIARYGDVRPFSNIVHAEKRHEQVVTTLMNRHGVTVPAAAAPEIPGVPATLAECNREAARLERENVAMYDRLMKEVSEPDIRGAFENLRAASLNNHLPAFERWSSESSGPGHRGLGGAGAGRGAGAGACGVGACGGPCAAAS